MNNNFITANKALGENVKNVNYLRYTHSKEFGFSINRAKFCEYLHRAGYNTYCKGNYITANRDNESNTFFFAAHRKGVTNYLIPSILKNRVQYFAFYDEENNCVYLVGYGKVREYTASIENAYIFGNSELKMLIPDTWAKEQIINKCVL